MYLCICGHMPKPLCEGQRGPRPRGAPLQTSGRTRAFKWTRQLIDYIEDSSTSLPRSSPSVSSRRRFGDTLGDCLAIAAATNELGWARHSTTAATSRDNGPCLERRLPIAAAFVGGSFKAPAAAVLAVPSLPLLCC
mmetsp:Transcript_48559/g.80467  ORF Transcript_48559/g.80467 Transcript_48559/m.80467 type:complete len:136 (-) Transcript_48559:1157-1564(-)